MNKSELLKNNRFYSPVNEKLINLLFENQAMQSYQLDLDRDDVVGFATLYSLT